MSLNHFARYIFVLIAITGISCSKKFNRLQKNGTTDEKYKAAIEYYNKADYYKAGILFEEITPLLKGDSTAERAQFYNAYCNYYQGQYQMSSYLFKNFYATYNNSPLAEEAFYMYAYSMFKDSPLYNLDQSSTLTAIDALQTFINTYPSSKYAENCNNDLKDLRFRLEKKAYEKAKLYYKTRQPSFGGLPNYKAAVVTIDNFRRDFPDSRYNEELAYIQIVAQYELANLSIYTKQRERYSQTVKFYENFIEKHTNSQYSKELVKIYDQTQKSLDNLAKIEKEIEEAKLKAANMQKAQKSS